MQVAEVLSMLPAVPACHGVSPDVPGPPAGRFFMRFLSLLTRPQFEWIGCQNGT